MFYTGDILNTLTKGHIVGVVEGKTRTTTADNSLLDKIAREVIAGKWGNGENRRRRLADAGYDYRTVQARVNQLLK